MFDCRVKNVPLSQGVTSVFVTLGSFSIEANSYSSLSAGRVASLLQIIEIWASLGGLPAFIESVLKVNIYNYKSVPP